MSGVHDDTPRSTKESAISTVATTITLTLDDVAAGKSHCFAGVRFFADSSGSTPATPGAGTVTITVETSPTAPVFEAVPSNVITAATPTTVNWGAPTKRVRATPDSITVATHYQLVVDSMKD